MINRIIILAAVLLLFTGCSTAVCRHYPAASGMVNEDGRPVVAEIRGRNFGIFLFYSIPIWCGTPHRPNEEEWDLWRNMVRERDIRRMLFDRATQLGADDIDELKISKSSSGFWSLWIFWHRSISGSCIAVKDQAPKSKKANLPGK